jgi:hypothetical protein
MGYCGGFGYTFLWAIAADLVMPYGPLRRMKPYSKPSVLISALWALVQDLVMRYGPRRRVWLSALGRSKGFGLALWAVAQDLVMRYGP